MQYVARRSPQANSPLAVNVTQRCPAWMAFRTSTQQSPGRRFYVETYVSEESADNQDSRYFGVDIFLEEDPIHVYHQRGYCPSLRPPAYGKGLCIPRKGLEQDVDRDKPTNDKPPS